MPDLNQLRQQITAARATRDEVARAHAAEEQRLRVLRQEASDFQRRFDPSKQDHQARQSELAALIDAKTTLTAQRRTAKQFALDNLTLLNGLLEPVTDPRTALPALDAKYPILLFPVRLETRFVTGARAGRPQKQLLVRIYPDECLIDGFEPDLSESEVKNLRRYWCGMWAAGGDEGLERAAWREFCAAHGAGRATYLVQQYGPLAGTDAIPSRDPTGHVILAVAVDAPLVSPEKNKIIAYWEAIWRAGNDDAAKAIAFDALRVALTDARAEEVRQTLVPFNIKDRPQAGVDRTTVLVSVVFVVMAPLATAATNRQAWTRAPEAALLPERFVLIADSGSEHLELLGGMIKQPLAVGPDPLAEAGEQFSQTSGDLIVPPPLKWMTDFEAALAAGMAFRIDLTERQAALGFERLYVLGVRLTADKDQGQVELEKLIRHLAMSQSGFALIPQGTPTNNSEEGSSGWSRVQEADELFDVVRLALDGQPQFNEAATSAYTKRDGLILAEALGINAAVFQDIANADGTDQAEARAMNAALWPATLGYWMGTQMNPIFSAATIERTRRHFINRVTGRGTVPAIRIGKQPYGILPTLAFSRLQWLNQAGNTSLTNVDAHSNFLTTLRSLLDKLAVNYWNNLANNVPRVGKPSTDSQQQLLDILGLHPSSVEFHLNVLDSADRIWNGFKFHLRGRSRLKLAMEAQMNAGVALLRELGYAKAPPEIISKFFAYVHGPMKRPVIDDPPLSEIDKLTICTDDNLNYIGWCRTKAQTAFDDLRLQKGFSAGKIPNALLYHVLRHALQLGYHRTAVDLHESVGLITPSQVMAAHREPAFVHIATAEVETVSESRYQMLYDRQPAITGGPDKTIAEFIPSWLAVSGSSSALADQIEALAVLDQADTASLERAFAEHIDLCSYRWDAWMLSLVNERLHRLRRPNGDASAREQGVYLGAFGWLEELKPDAAALPGATLSAEAAAVFLRPGDGPLQRDPANGGHVLAPSLNHAVTAAVLRNGYLSNAEPASPDLFAIDLSSSRVRVALQFIEGMRNGQPLGALLGYQLERRLHDRHAEAEMDALIYQVRKAFPLAGKRIRESVDAEAEAAAIEHVEARNVCDGMLLLEHVRTNPIKSYPWGKSLDPATPSQQAIIDQEVTALFEIHDAMADVVMAESVHQVTTGNTERAAAALDAFSKGGFPPEPEVVTTPRSGIALTHRVGLHLPVAAVAPGTATPRAKSEPAIDAWLESVLPPLADIVVRVNWQDTPPGSAASHTDVDMQSLGLRPIDLVHILDTGNEQAMNELDDRLVDFVISHNLIAHTPPIELCPDSSVEIRYTERVVGKKTAFEVAPMVASLRALVLDSRPLQSSDALLQNEAVATAAVVPDSQMTIARNSVDQLRTAAGLLQAVLAPLIPHVVPFGTVVAAVDAAITSFVSLQFAAGFCGVALTGAGAILKARRDWFELVRANADDVLDRWQVKLAQCDTLLAEAVDPSRSDLMQIEALEKAEREISTWYTSPLPTTPAPLLAVVTAKRTAFTTALTQIQAVSASAATTIDQLWTLWSATFAARPSLDLTIEDTTREEENVRIMLRDMQQQVTGLIAELEKRLAKADGLIADAAAASGQQKAVLLADAAKALLGEGFRILPRFTLSTEQGDEWQNAFDARANLLTHLSPAHEFPVDDWLHGVARVRSKLHDLENVILLADAFDTTEPVLAPVQFPFRAAEPWLGLELPAGWDMSTAGDHLLYTASYPNNAFDKTATEFGGLLLDEWTEVVPGAKETAGLAFNYDRPSHEPPQTMLLVTPAGIGERWNWEDLRAAVPETFDLARKRAVEPRDISQTPLARLLPATLMAFTTNAISISSELRVADVVFAAEMEDHG